MIRILLQKDLWRVRRNPWPYLINLALPIIITSIIGLTFGKSGSGQGMGKIKIAIVDEDENMLGSFLSGVFSQGEAEEYFAPAFMERTDAVGLLKKNKLSAVYIIPDGFTEAYLEATPVPPLQLMKNPSQRYFPAIVEEFMGIVVEGLNAVARNLEDELPEMVGIVEENELPDMVGLAAIMVKMGVKFQKAENYLFPPLVTFTEITAPSGEKKAEGNINIFAILLPMLTSVFLIFMADSSVRDIYNELNQKTLARIKTVRNQLFPIIASKTIFAVMSGVFGGLVLFVGGGLIFQIQWKAPLQIFVLLVSYGICAAGFMAMLVGLFKTEKRAESFSSIVILAIAFLGGGFFTVDTMPDFVKNHISPWMPNYWFIQSIQALQLGHGSADWTFEALKMVLLGSCFLLLGTYWIHRHLDKGGKL